jgi:S-adenosylmethionine uptake transporter
MGLSALSFAAMGILAHGLAGRVDWRLVVLVRTGVSFLLAAALSPAATWAALRAPPRALVARSLAGSLAIVLTFYALPRLPVAHAVTLRNTTPVWVALLGGGAFPGKALGAALAGVLLLERPDLVGLSLPALASLAAAMLSGVAMLGLNRLRGTDPQAVVAHFSLAATLGVLLLIGTGPSISPWPGDAAAAAAMLGVALTGTLAQLALTRAYATGEPVRIALVGLLEIVFAAGLEALVFGRGMGVGEVLGVGLVMAGPALVAKPPPAGKA